MAGRALWYGTAAHALDFDDYEDVGSTHPSACIVAALLAVAEAHPISTGAMLAAYVQGFEAILTFGMAMGHAHYLAGWHSTSTLGGVGAAAAVAHLLRLSSQDTGLALSIAATQASGFKRQFGSDVKALHCGLAARNGVEAALLARAGVTARTDILDGPGGFLAVFGGQAAYWHDHPQPRIEDHPPYVKPWPCCAYTHRAIEAALALAAQVDTAQTAEATLEMPAPYAEVAGQRAPTCEAEGRFSASFCAASALIDGHLTEAAFAEAALARPAVRALEAKIALCPYPLPAGAGDMSAEAPDTLTLNLSDGRTLSHCVAETRGSPARPLSTAELVDKLVQCGGTVAAAHRFFETPATAPFEAPIRMTSHDQTHAYA
jgi:2-methylcitrate dehydratase PrpD